MDLFSQKGQIEPGNRIQHLTERSLLQIKETREKITPLTGQDLKMYFNPVNPVILSRYLVLCVTAGVMV